MSKKVLIGTPVHDSKNYCWEKWVEAVNALTYPKFDLLLLDNSNSKQFVNEIGKFRQGINAYVHIVTAPDGTPVRNVVAYCQEIIREASIAEGYDYLFMLEQDNIPAPDTIEYLISQNFPVVGIPYWKFEPEQKLNYVVWQQLYQFGHNKLEALLTPVMDVLAKFDGRPKQVFNIGLGCLLIEKKVLNRFTFHVEKGEEAHSDTYVAKRLFENDIPVMAVTERFCEHLDTGLQTAKLTVKGRKMLYAVGKAVHKHPLPSKKLFFETLKKRSV